MEKFVWRIQSKHWNVQMSLNIKIASLNIRIDRYDGMKIDQFSSASELSTIGINCSKC